MSSDSSRKKLVPLSLSESYAWCRSLSRRTGRNFYYSFLTLAREKSRDMSVLYAFMRTSDDLGDDESVPPLVRAARLDEWRVLVMRALSGDPGEHPVLPALGQIVDRYAIPPQYLLEVIDGVRSDLRPGGFETFEELSHYCYRVAGVVGLCCVHVWGFSDPRACGLAIDCGTAFQLTNIIRDLGRDAQAGRVYLPREELRRFEYSAEDLAAGVVDERFTRLMQFQHDRAVEYYRRAEGLFDHLDRSGRAVLAAMLGIYRRLLREIERRGFDVFSQPVSLAGWKKLGIAVWALVRHRWFGRFHSRRVAPVATPEK